MRLNPAIWWWKVPSAWARPALPQRLAEDLRRRTLLEHAEENPFLERFYRDPKNAALPTQLSFLFQRARQLQQLRQGDIFQPTRVADFLLEKDRLFARLNLDDEEFKLYEQVYQHLTLDAPRPDLVIYLQAPVEVLCGVSRTAASATSGSSSMNTW